MASADSTFALWPDSVWTLTDGSLTPRNRWELRALGVLVHLSQHLFGYTFAALFLLVPVLQLRSVAHKPVPTSMASGCGQAVFALASGGLLLIWLYVVTLLTELWVLWVVTIALTVYSVGARIRRGSQLKGQGAPASQAELEGWVGPTQSPQ